MNKRKNICKNFDNFDGLLAAIFVNAYNYDIDTIEMQVKSELENRGIHHATIKKYMTLYKNQIKNLVAKWIIREYENYPRNNIKHAYANRKTTKRMIIKQITEDLKLNNKKPSS